MNVYDFDKTIYYYDSTKQFYKFLLKKYPKMAFRAPAQFIAFLKYRTGIWTKTQMKEVVYSAFRYIPDIKAEVEKFWETEINNIKPWYLKQQKPDDLIISASPFFLLEPICTKLGITELLASEVNEKTGKYTGLNCYGEEKVERLIKYTGNTKMNEFYSDSLSDSPLAYLADSSFLVEWDKIMPWPKK